MSRTMRAVPFRKQRQHRESMRALAQYAPSLRAQGDPRDMSGIVSADRAALEPWDMP